MENLENFRSEVRAWLDENCPSSMRTGADPQIPHDEVWGGRNAEYKNPESKIWLDRMGAKGWTMPTVPKEYGGGGLDKDQVKILNEELFLIGAKTPLLSFGIWMLAPVLLEYGSEEQKRNICLKLLKVKLDGVRDTLNQVQAQTWLVLLQRPKIKETTLWLMVKKFGHLMRIRLTGSLH